MRALLHWLKISSLRKELENPAHCLFLNGLRVKNVLGIFKIYFILLQSLNGNFCTYENYMKFKIQPTNYILLKHSHTHLFTYYLRFPIVELNNCYRLHGLQNLKYFTVSCFAQIIY